MTKKDLLNIIGKGETIELKNSFTKTVIETIVAFSNKKGGKIIAGCNDKGEMVGTSVSEKSVQNCINEVKQNTEPTLSPDFIRVTIGLKENLNLNEGLQSLLEVIRQNPGIQAKELPELLNKRPLKTIERQISELTKAQKN